MNDNPKSPEFDWVTAREKCSLEREFFFLKRLVKQNCETKKGFLRKNHPGRFSFTEESEREFFVSRVSKEEGGDSEYVVLFERRNDHINISSQLEELEWEITVELNDKGECCFTIIGEDGEYLRWQIARRALSPIFLRVRKSEGDYCCSGKVLRHSVCGNKIRWGRWAYPIH